MTNLLLVLQIILLTLMVITLAGMIIPVFPGPTVIFVMALINGVVAGLDARAAIFLSLIGVLAVIGTTVDNIFVIGKARQSGSSWGSIVLAFFVGIVGSLLVTPLLGIPLMLLVMFLWEYKRLGDQAEAWETVKGMLVGWGWSFVARIGVGIAQIILFAVWVWVL